LNTCYHKLRAKLICNPLARFDNIVARGGIGNPNENYFIQYDRSLIDRNGMSSIL